MINQDRKRKLSRTSRDENGIDVDLPQTKHRKTDQSDEESAEDGPQSIGEKLSGLFTWFRDVTTKNYFVESAMSALSFGSRLNGQNKHHRLKSKKQIQMNEEEDEPVSSRIPRCDLKRTPLRESYKKSSQNYLTLPRSSQNQKKSSLSIRNMGSRAPKRSSNALLEQRKVIENPFKSSQKFSKLQQINHLSTGTKMENHKTNHFESSFSPGDRTNFCMTDSEGTTPVSSSNCSKFFTNASSPPPKVKVVGSVLYKRQGRTTDSVLELQERDQYQLLLEQFTKCSMRQNSGTKSPTLEDKEVQTNICGPSVYESPMQQAFKKKTLDATATSFLAKYFKGHTYGITPNFSQASRPTTFNKSVVPSPKKTENEDDLIIAEVKLPQPRSFLPFRSPLPTSPFFSPEWISELKKSFDEDAEEKVRVIRDQEEKIKQFRETRAARLAEKEALDKRRGTVTAISEAEVEDTSIEFPELTAKMEEMIDEALNPEPPEEVLCVGFNISVSRKDIETLSGLNWLNDEIIYFYMNLLMERSKNDNYPSVFAFNTFFYPKLLTGGHSVLKRWTRKMDIFSYDLILVPVHMGMHWCLAVIDFRHKKIRYYDSMGGQNKDCLNALREYLKEESLDKKKETLDMNGWVLENVKNIPHQMNGSDCGMFTLKYAEYITRDAKITFTQDHMQYFRRRMVYEILTKQLL